jgi:hypothetical protein
MEVGNHVDVWFSGADALFNVIIIHIPADTGDSWEFQSTDGLLHRSIMFEKMSQLPNAVEAGQPAHNSSSHEMPSFEEVEQAFAMQVYGNHVSSDESHAVKFVYEYIARHFGH